MIPFKDSSKKVRHLGFKVFSHILGLIRHNLQHYAFMAPIESICSKHLRRVYYPLLENPSKTKRCWAVALAAGSAASEPVS